jgi:hypothetical protein
MSLFRSIQHLLPTGESFRLGVNKYVTEFWQGLGNFADSAKTYVDLVYLDLFPDTTRELEEWEQFYGLSPSASATEVERRMALAAEWRATGGQSPAYIQSVLQTAGFDFYLHEWWESTDPWVARDPHDYTDDPTFGSFQCYDNYDPLGPSVEPWLTAGDADAQADAWLANETHYWANATLSDDAPPPIPNDPDAYPYFLYFSGATFPDPVLIYESRRAELKRLIQKLKPSQQWIVCLAEYVDPLLTEDGAELLTEGGEPLYA